MAPTPDPDPPPTPASTWTRLQLSHRRTTPNLPPLFYKLITQSPRSSAPNAPRLVLHCTDLTVLYTASLTHADILAEAARQHSPIDPAESSKQFAVLLDYLAQSLAAKDNVLACTIPANKDTTAPKSSGDADSSSSSHLTLRTTISLPRPLRPLSFAFALARQPPTAFSRVVLHPALQGTQAAHRKLTALLDVVRDKDHVIARLLERVGSQASGDMSLVFPTLTGRRGRGGEKVGVEEAGRLVPGLREFDLGAWERGQGVDEGGGLEGAVLEGGLAESLKEEEGNAEWVQRLPGPEVLERDDGIDGKRRLSRQVTRDTTRGSQADGDKAGEEDDDDNEATESEDEFERQPTPPSTRKAAGSTTTTPQKSAAVTRQTRESSASSDQEDAGPPAKKQRTSAGSGGVGSGKRAGRLGGLGGFGARTKRAVNKVSSPEQDAASASPAVAKDDEKGAKRRPSTASTATASPTESEDEPAPPPPTTRSSKIPARSGGKREPSSTPSTASPPPDPALSDSAPAKKKGKGRLGRLGGARARNTDTRSSSVEMSGGDAPRQAAVDNTTARHRLGKLGGGRKKAAADEEETESEDEAEVAHGDRNAKAPSAAAGLGGGHRARQQQHKKGATEKEDEDEDGDVIPPLHPQPEHRQESEQEPEEPETAEQAAARRREELKQTAAKAPARKKRRF